VYDGFGRRQTATRDGTTASFLYDVWDVVQEQQGGNPSADLILGLGVDERLSRSGAIFLTDALGSTAALVNSGVVQTSYGYDPYGVAQVTGISSDNSFQYTGRENDGTGLLNYRNRYYNPSWGRFISEDPIGLAGGDVNLHRYASNNPIQLRDPSGLLFTAETPPGIGPDPGPTPPSGPSPVDSGGGTGPEPAPYGYGPPASGPSPTPSGSPPGSGPQVAQASPSRTAQPGPPCSGPNSDCSGGTRGTFPDPTQPGRFLCIDCFIKTFGEKPK
jgi:RHS repeat-associated protein